METHRRWVEGLVALAVVAYVFQATLRLGWGPLTEWQAQTDYKLATGLVMATVIAWMWVQSLVRTGANRRGWLSLHRLGGLVGVVVLFAHATRWGHGFLTGLAWVFLGTVAIGTVSPQTMRTPSPRYQRTWLFCHIILALVLVAGVGFHMWIGLTYE